MSHKKILIHFKHRRKLSVFAKREVRSFTHAQLIRQQKARGEHVRCDAVDWGLLKQDFIYSKEITRNSLLCESGTFFAAFFVLRQWEKVSF